MYIVVKRITIYVGLVLGLLLSQMLAGISTSFFMTLPADSAMLSIPQDPIALLIIAALEALAIQLLFPYLAATKKIRFVQLFILYWGTKFLMMHIEATFFLLLWQSEPIMSWPELNFLYLYGVIQVGIFSILAVYPYQVSNTHEEHEAAVKVLRLPNVIAVAACYVVVYYLAGMFLAMPLAGESFFATYENLNLPSWHLIFQFVRGLIWVAILFPCLSCAGSKVKSKLILSGAFAVFAATQLLHPNAYMETTLRLSHLVELFISMFVFGYLAIFILKRENKSG